MKTKLTSETGSRLGLCLAISATALLVSGLAAMSQTAFPVGTWDCVMNGPRQGVAYITFTNVPDASSNFSFTCHEILVPKGNTAETSVQGRNDGGKQTREGVETEAGLIPGQQIFGSELVGGPWNYDKETKRVIGHFIEISEPVCSTNVVPLQTNTPVVEAFPFSPPLTNGPDSNQVFCVTSTVGTNDSFGFTNQTICYSNELTCHALTNAISFVAKGTHGKRLTLVTSTPFGRVVYHGVPAKQVKDISGSWQGVKRQDFVDYQEFFTLTPSLFSEFPNVYHVSGSGPGYSYTNSGLAILSSQNKIGFVVTLDPGTPPGSDVIRAVTGPFNFKKVKANTKGLEKPLGEERNAITFKAIRSSP